MQRLADQLLGDIGAVGIGGVDEVDAELRQALQRADRLGAGRPASPQMPGPVMRMAPKPRRWISISPPILNDPDLRASSLVIFVFS